MAIKELDYYVLDMDGTVYLGDEVLPGARELIAFFEEAGIRYCFFTNNSSKSALDYTAKLKRLGIADNPHIITSGDVTADYILKTFGPSPRAYVVGTEPLVMQLTAAGIDCADTAFPDCVVVGFDTTYRFEKAARAVDLLRQDIPFIATNIDAVCPLEGGKVLPDCGSICAMLTHATGRKPKFIGKPFAETAGYIMRNAGRPAHNIGVVGDRLYTDMRLAIENGMCAIGVLSGEMTKDDIALSGLKPHYLFDSAAQLLEVLRET